MNVKKSFVLIGAAALVLAATLPAQAAVRTFTQRVGATAPINSAIPAGAVVVSCQRNGQANASPC